MLQATACAKLHSATFLNLTVMNKVDWQKLVL